GLAALVAGIGIINTMLMSVLERFKEIGALKAVGWTSMNVLLMVLLESLFLGIVGGILGIGVGFLAGSLIQLLFGLSTKISLDLIIQSFLFALIISLAAGLYPAYRASKMDPIQALREE
ncbi:FtsX-like permease family protein, partial [archaeon]|nr:FtsX-like permease family protein [archaeon]